MTFAFSQRDIEAVAALPPLPVMSPKPQTSMSDSEAELVRAVEKYKADSSVWRTTLSENLGQLKQMMAVAAEPGNDTILRLLRDDILSGLIDSVDLAINAMKENRTAHDAHAKAKLEQINAASPQIARHITRIEKQYLTARDEQYDWAVQFYYALLALRAEFDPEARGGPTFENADDLIPSLHS